MTLQELHLFVDRWNEAWKIACDATADPKESPFSIYTDDKGIAVMFVGTPVIEIYDLTNFCLDELYSTIKSNLEILRDDIDAALSVPFGQEE